MSKKHGKKDVFETDSAKKTSNPFGDEEDDSRVFYPEDMKKSSKTKKKKKKKQHQASNPFDSKRKRKRKKKTYCWWAAPLSAACIIILGFITLYCINTAFDYKEFKLHKASLLNEKYYDGIVIDSYDVSGYTVAEAVEYWEKYIETPLRETSIVFDTGDGAQCINCEELGYKSDYESVLLNAWSNGRTGTFEERYRSLRTIKKTSSHTDVTRTLFDENLLRAYTDSIAESLTVEPVNAQVLDFDVSTHEFTLGDSEYGSYVDADKLFEEAKTLLENGGGRLVVDVEYIAPKVFRADLEGGFGMISQAVTNASASTSDRLTNLRVACAAINGTVVMPGETFSYNDVVGERTKAKGYKIATVYQSGEVAEDIGGGVCQVSTTLWNAAMKADCEIVERYAHSRPVSYVDKGKDATVSWKSQDMKFRNTSEYPMYIIAYVGTNKRVYCEVYGKLFDDGVYITIEATTTEKIEPGEPSYSYNPALGKGQQVVVSEARTGYKAKAYRVYHSADGKVISKVLLCSSYYKEAAAKIEYGG